MKFTELARDLKEGIRRVYLIQGEEAYFRDHAVSSVRAACGLTQPALNDVRYEGEVLKGEKLSEVLASLTTLPFFDEFRLVRLYEFYPTGKDLERFSAYLSAPCETTVLLIVNTGAKKSELAKKKGLTFVDCGRESEDVLCRWLFGLARRAKLAPESDAVALMVRYCNFDAARMSLEIRKLAVLLGEGGALTKEVVEAYVAKDVDYKIYELTHAASRGNGTVFSEILHDLLEKGSDENAVLGALTSHFRTLAEIASMKGTDEEIAKLIGIKPYAVRKNRETVVRLGKGRARELYAALYELSAGMRCGNCTKWGALSAAIAKIFLG